MEMQWYLDRHYLRCLKHSHPDWSQRRLAEETGYSKTWVQKWCKRFEQADQNDEPILHSQSRARHHPPPSLDQTVVDEIIKIRDEPPEGLNRTPGPQAIRYYLGRSEVVTGQVPAGTTIWR